MRVRLLQARGWTVASIPFYEWKKHRGLPARQQYLKTKLPQVCHAAHAKCHMQSTCLVARPSRVRYLAPRMASPQVLCGAKKCRQGSQHCRPVRSQPVPCCPSARRFPERALPCGHSHA